MIQRYAQNKFIENDEGQGWWNSFLQRVRLSGRTKKEVRNVAEGLALGQVRAIRDVQAIRQAATIESGEIRKHHFLVSEDHRMATIAERERLADVAQLHSERVEVAHSALMELEEMLRRHSEHGQPVQEMAGELLEQLNTSLRGRRIHES